MTMRCTDPPLTTLRNQYFSLYPPPLIQLPELSTLTLARSQEWLVNNLLLHPKLHEYQPELQYRRKFWKLVIVRLESELANEQAQEEELELDDRLADMYAELVSTPTSDGLDPTPAKSHKTYIYPSSGSSKQERMITLLESQTTIESGSTGFRTWTASLFLATLLLKNPLLLSTPSSRTESLLPVLELGSGLGFLSIFLAQLGCPKVWASDIGDEISENEEQNTDIIGNDCRTPCKTDYDLLGEDLGSLNVSREGVTSRTSRSRLRSLFSSSSQGLGEGRLGPLRSLQGNLELNADRIENPVLPISLDWMDALEISVSDDDDSNLESVERRTAMEDLSKSLPEDLVIVAADVIYDPDLVLPLVSTLKLFLTNTNKGRGGRYGLFAATVRNVETLEKFERTCYEFELDLKLLSKEELEGKEDKNEPADHKTIFWNANTWEGEDVRVMRITNIEV